MPELKKFQKSKCEHHSYIRCHLCATFDVLRPSQSCDIFWRKNSHPPAQPDTQLISPWIREPQYLLHTEENVKWSSEEFSKYWLA